MFSTDWIIVSRMVPYMVSRETMRLLVEIKNELEEKEKRRVKEER